ncbi:MAG: N-acetylmuramoyl-L-alanine amidase [Thermoproteota archaeon]
MELLKLLFSLMFCIVVVASVLSPSNFKTNGESDTTDYSNATWVPANKNNFSPSERKSNEIRWIVIHDIEGSAEAAVSWFQNERAKASAHYIVDYNGKVYQMVREKDIAWHAGNWKYNVHSVGIEHAGFADKDMFTDEEYVASAKLVAYLCKKYNIPIVHWEGIAPEDPKNGSGIIGHYQVPDPNNPSLGGGASHHYDPGKYWNWSYFIALVKKFYYLNETARESKKVVAVWWGMYSDYWSSDYNTWKKQVYDAMEKLSKAGVNTIFFLAKDPWGYAYYNSSVAPLSKKYSWDVLKEVCEAARKYNISLHAYVNALSEGEEAPNFYLLSHKDQALYDQSGEMLGWADPGSEEYVGRLLSIVKEIISNYKVDGIQLDRIRAPPNAFGKASEEKFRQTYNKDPKSNMDLWNNFLREEVSELVKKVYELTKSVNTSLYVSAAVFPAYDLQGVGSSLRYQLQDWKKWISNKYVDFVCTMAYTSDFNKFKVYVDDEVKVAQDPNKVYIGVGAWLLNKNGLKEQMDYVFNKSKLNGVVFFNADSLLKSNELLSGIAEYLKEGYVQDEKGKFFIIFLTVSFLIFVFILFGLFLKLKHKFSTT